MIDTTTDRVGDWMQTFTGRRFWPLDPRPEDICIEDIAHHLSMICRYNGAVRRFYSVAEHSLLICRAMTELEPESGWHQLQALMHDAAEAYLCDLIRPIKHAVQGYADAEYLVESAIQKRFNLYCIGKTSVIDSLDSRILYDEAEALMPVTEEPWHWRLGPPLGVEILGLSPSEAEAAFLEEFQARYTGGAEALPGG